MSGIVKQAFAWNNTEILSELLAARRIVEQTAVTCARHNLLDAHIQNIVFGGFPKIEEGHCFLTACRDLFPFKLSLVLLDEFDDECGD
jgi:hypothetical protein